MQKDVFGELLKEEESSTLDWKLDFPEGLLQDSKNPDWKKGKAILLKDIVSMANSDDAKTSRLVYGVLDHEAEREVEGISQRWDDATFQTWAHNAFDPPPKFLYTELPWKADQVVGIFAIEHVPDYPHVATRTVESVFYKGQVWYRVGTKNTVADYRKLRDMFLPQEPFVVEGLEGPIHNETKEHYESEGRTVQWLRFASKDDKIAQGYSLAYRPGTRRPIVVVVYGGKPDLILMVRP